MHNSLDDKKENLIEFLKNEGFNVFYAKESSESKIITEVIWDNENDEKEFFEIAKKEGIKTIIAEILMLSKDNLDLNILTEEDDIVLNDEIIKQKLELDKFSKFIGQVGSYRFSWIKDGVKYVISESTGWFEDYAGIVLNISSLTNDKERYVEREEEEGIPPELKKKSEEELSDEMVEFIKEQDHPLDNHMLYTIKEMFWSKKGIPRFTSNPQLRFIMSKVEMIAEKRIEDAEMSVEKEELPGLIDECIKWCKEYGLKKIIKSNIKAFLAEKNTSLSKHSEDILYQKVNFKIKMEDNTKL